MIKKVLGVLLLVSVLGVSACASARISQPSPSVTKEHPRPKEADEYPQEWRLLTTFLDLYERNDLASVKSLFVPELQTKEMAYLVYGLEKLVWPDKVLEHRFRILTTKFYVGDMDGRSILMGEVTLCDEISAYRIRSQDKYQYSFSVFYHIHFDRDRGLFESFSLPLVEVSDCTP